MSEPDQSAVVVSADAEGRKVNRYDLSIYDGLPKVGDASQELQKVAISYGLGTLRTSWKDFSARDASGKRISFGLSFSEASSPVSGVITSNKQLTRQFLESAQAAVPRGRTFRMREIEAAVNYATGLGYPVVVKPLAGKSGLGVVAGIVDSQGVRWAVDQIVALQGAQGRFIVEEHVSGQDYRIYVAYGEVLSVVLRRPASVTGNGVHSVADLIEHKNKLRRHNPHTRTRLIRADDSSTYHLANQGLHWESVPEAGRVVQLAAAANISRGGDSVEVLSETHPSILAAAVRAANAIPGLNQAGVDFLLADHRTPLAEQSGGICEINATPALMASQAPVFGEVQPVAQRLVRAAAEAEGLALTDEPQDRARISVRARGVQAPEQLAGWTVSHARRLGLGGRVRSVGQRRMAAQLRGPVDRVTALVAAMHSGSLNQRPDSVRTAPSTSRMPDRFEGGAL
jgi:D-alanine-D-alanine ligase-like ATP-grasp enzyme